MSPAAVIRLQYGYRFTRYTQADIGLDIVIHAAGIKEAGKHDIERMIPLGGRIILPLFAERFELFAGAGPARLSYSEYQGANIPCPECATRSGWGVYGTAGANIALEHTKHVCLGIEAQYLKGTTSGKLLETGIALESKDRWLSTTLNLVGRF
jgi:hypothetical protein